MRREDADKPKSAECHLRESVGNANTIGPTTAARLVGEIDRLRANTEDWKQIAVSNGSLVDSLRSELAAVKAENLRMREAINTARPYLKGLDSWELARMADAVLKAALATPKAEKPEGHDHDGPCAEFCQKAEKPKCVCDHLENQHTRRSPIGLLGCASCSCLAYEGNPKDTEAGT